MIGVGGRLFGVMVLNAFIAVTIGLGAFNAFGRLHDGFFEITAELFPAVVASAKLERQHQRLMRSIEQLALAPGTLAQETLRQSLSDQLTGYDLLLTEVSGRAGANAETLRDLRSLRDDIVAVRDRIDALVTTRLQARAAGRERDREIQIIADTLSREEWRSSPDPLMRQWLGLVDQLLLVAASAYRLDSSHALTGLAQAIDQGLRNLRATVPESAPLHPIVAPFESLIGRLIIGDHSILHHRRSELQAIEGISRLLDRADQASLATTGLNTGVFVDNTSLAERRRQEIIKISELYMNLFMGSIWIVVIGSIMTMIYVQRKVVGRLLGVRDALRDNAAGGPSAIPAGGSDEISELASALRFYIQETESKSAELRRNEQWLRALIDSAPLPLILTSIRDGLIRLANQRAQDLFRFDAVGGLAGTAGASLWAFPQERETFIAQVIRDGGAQDFEGQFLTAGGDRFWGLASGSSFEFQGEQVAMISVVNISATKQAQHEMQLAKERAERADSAKTEFLATMSHEMRTPLNGILGLGRLLLTGGLRPSERRHAEAIMRCGRALLDQVNDILDLRRIEDGKLDLDPTPCVLRTLLADVIATIDSLASEKHLRLDLHIATDLPPVIVVEQQRLRQILINLLGNAIKFTAAGHVGLAASREQDHLILRVSDTGIGIPAHRQDAIFDMMEQADPSIPRRFGGSGLGLAIVRQLLTALGGSITVESVEGKGSTFTIRLPLIPGQTSDLPVIGPGLQLSNDRPLRLLLVEDDRVNREVAIGLLGDAGHSLTVAETGAQALDLFAGGWFDAVLLDIRLPDIEGVEVARRIRQLEEPDSAAVPIIAVTANVFAGDKQRYLAAGMDAVIEKPLFPETLERVLATLPIRPQPPGLLNQPAPLLNDSKLQDYHRRLGSALFITIRGLLLEVAAEKLPLLLAPTTSPGERAALAHGLTSSAGHFGFDRFIACTRQIEAEAEQAEPAQLEALCQQAASLFQHTNAALDEWCQRQGIPIAPAPPAD